MKKILGRWKTFNWATIYYRLGLTHAIYIIHGMENTKNKEAVSYSYQELRITAKKAESNILEGILNILSSMNSTKSEETVWTALLFFKS